MMAERDKQKRQFPGKYLAYVDMDLTLCDYVSAYKKSRTEHPEISYPQSVPGFFTNLEPLPHAIDTLIWLDQHRLFEVYILTAPSVKNPNCYTEKRLWVEQHLGYGFAEKLIISPNKGLLLGDYLIDDNIAGKGQEFFQGEIIEFGSADYPDWLTVKAKLKSVMFTYGN